MGFGVPVGNWFKNDLKGFTENIILDTTALKRGYFNKKSIEHLFSEHYKGKKDHSSRLWNLLWLELWHRIYIDREDLKMPKTMNMLM